jgi:hypothetical protein
LCLRLCWNFNLKRAFELSFCANSNKISPMSKPTMGRGLGALMSERKPQSETQNQSDKTQIASGVRTLIQGHNTPSVAPASRFSAPQITDSKGPAIPRWYFLVADALLIGLALAIAFTSPKGQPMPTSRMIFAIAVVVMAAGCGFCALIAGADKS